MKRRTREIWEEDSAPFDLPLTIFIGIWSVLTAIVVLMLLLGNLGSPYGNGETLVGIPVMFVPIVIARLLRTHLRKQHARNLLAKQNPTLKRL